MKTLSKHPIAVYRAKNGLTLEAFGALVGVQKSAVNKWEDGLRPSPHMAIKIEQVVGIPRYMLRPDLWGKPRVKL